MADYVSNYTGPEIDGILEDAIELPEITSEDKGKVLTINSSGEPAWRHNEVDVFGNGITCQDDPGNNVIEEGSVLTLVDVSSSLYACWVPPSQGGSIDTSDANDGEFLKYGSNGLEWDNPIDTSGASDGNFLKYDNGYLSWDNPIDTSGASDGEFLKYSSNTGIMWDSISGLPDNPGSGDHFLMVTDNGHSINWVSPTDLSEYGFYQLPTLPNEGVYLLVSNNGLLEWQEQE